MKTGETDTAVINPDKLQEARQLPNITVYEWWPATATWYYVGLNMRPGFVTSDIHVRHGLSYAIDKDLITSQIMLGQARRLCSIYPETSWAYNPDVECYKYDTAKALAEFTQAGYTQQDGKLVDKDGKQLTLKLLYGPNTSQIRQLMAVAIQDDLRKIGIQVNIQALEWSSFLQATQSKQPDWDMYIGAWVSPIEPHIMYTLWSEENIPDLNSVAYINKKVEQLFTEAGGTYDEAVRKAKYGEIQKILADDSPYIFLFYNKASSGQNNRIKGIQPTALGIGWNSDDWYIGEAPAQ
jgi:peptide/nickel transport system substrate-binding protein